MNYSEQFADAYEDLQKAIRDRSHLTQKVITDKNGHTRKVWVKVEENKNNKRVVKKETDSKTENDTTSFENKDWYKNQITKYLSAWFSTEKFGKLEAVSIAGSEKNFNVTCNMNTGKKLNIKFDNNQVTSSYDGNEVVKKLDNSDDSDETDILERIQASIGLLASKTKKETGSKNNKLPDDFNSYSKETQQNIKNAKYSIVSATYTDDSGKTVNHKFGVVMQNDEDSVFNNAKDVVESSILYGAYGRNGKKEVQKVEEVSPYDFEKITRQKVGPMADQAKNKDYSYKAI